MASQASIMEPALREQANLLRDFLHLCAASGPCEQAERLREADTLLPCRQPEASAGRRIAMDAMLANHAFESAALLVIGAETGFMVSRGASGLCLASVVLPGDPEESTAEGATIALALLAAYTSARLVLLERSGAAASLDKERLH